ncbi:terminase small subunit [Dyella sp. M7H15-1]|uniref:terminase small subunit n=1 Tax=Dyella sp. M7H15-1 TaxID=2501295 RepID=UPI00100513C9|nr:terminase small subunit [Dyella sp. M7H15-1]QAU22880.1 terminase small subunit [Dyella sp. M7H15-1]
MAKRAGKQVNRSELADTFGVSLPTIDDWVRNGCPWVQRGGRGVEWVFDTAAVARWLRDKAAEAAVGDISGDAEEWKRRKIAAEAQREELKLAADRKLVAPVEQMERQLARVFAEIRAKLRNIPGRTVTTLIGMTDERKFKQILLAEIDDTLTSLAELDLSAGEDSDDDEPDADE